VPDFPVVRKERGVELAVFSVLGGARGASDRIPDPRDGRTQLTIVS
jgi:hypothetical protein